VWKIVEILGRSGICPQMVSGQNPPGQNPLGQNPPGQNPLGQNALGVGQNPTSVVSENTPNMLGKLTVLPQTP